MTSKSEPGASRGPKSRMASWTAASFGRRVLPTAMRIFSTVVLPFGKFDGADCNGKCESNGYEDDPRLGSSASQPRNANQMNDLQEGTVRHGAKEVVAARSGAN